MGYDITYNNDEIDVVVYFNVKYKDNDEPIYLCIPVHSSSELEQLIRAYLDEEWLTLSEKSTYETISDLKRIEKVTFEINVLCIDSNDNWLSFDLYEDRYAGSIKLNKNTNEQIAQSIKSHYVKQKLEEITRQYNASVCELVDLEFYFSLQWDFYNLELEFDQKMKLVELIDKISQKLTHIIDSMKQ